ncbi:MAG: hypothetical protein QOK25_2811 [Thermoleophilaceae bacterium]|nr:hypothetical protein [Thermoleophilaceae bacterium]
MARPSEMHLSHRSNWLRAAVLGANDGIVSTASLVGEPELRADPEGELRELAAIYVRRVCAGDAIVARAAISHSWLSPPRRSGR